MVNGSKWYQIYGRGERAGLARHLDFCSPGGMGGSPDRSRRVLVVVLYLRAWFCIQSFGIFMLEFCWSVLVCFLFVLAGFGWVCYGVNVCSFDFFLLRKLAGVCASDQTWPSSLRSYCVCPLVRGVFIFLIFLLKIAVAMAHGLRQIRLRCRHQAPCSSCETCYIGASNMLRCLSSRLFRSPCGGRVGSIPSIML